MIQEICSIGHSPMIGLKQFKYTVCILYVLYIFKKSSQTEVIEILEIVYWSCVKQCYK